MITRRNFISGAGVLTTYSALGHDAEAAHRVLLLSSTTIISPISLDPSTNQLYICAVVGGAVTPASASDLVFSYAGVRD